MLLVRIELLGIVQAAKLPREVELQPATRKDRRRRHDWTRQRAATRLVHAGDERQTLLPKLGFMRQTMPVFCGHAPVVLHVIAHQ